ncbi:hypothetical protein BACCIP111899_03496 [Bacillus rhizoplanae]|uniref:Uncharacterized protein n=1 Tax=Bacillus rhizoplanae TaxID=2880966 RepID=A0ABN8A3T1_9BACI|nr:hypothetical protein [Bacillus rhizoplanae]CAG9614269.1 hypothetical protein BACCIP111899_03496 [Bacillus rhizoplanae]
MVKRKQTLLTLFALYRNLSLYLMKKEKGFRKIVANVHLSRYSWAVRPPPQDSEKSEEDRWGITARKSPIGSTNHQWGMKKPH